MRAGGAGGLWPATSLVALAQHHPRHVPLHNGRRHGRVSSSPRGPCSRQSVAAACLRLSPGRATGGGARGGPAPGQGPLLRAPCRSAEPSGTAGTVRACHPRHAGRRLPTEPPTALALLEVPRRPAHCPARPHERPWPAAALLPRPTRHRTDPALPAAPPSALATGACSPVRRSGPGAAGTGLQPGGSRPARVSPCPEPWRPGPGHPLSSQAPPTADLGKDSDKILQCLQLGPGQGPVGGQLHPQEVVQPRLQVRRVQLPPARHVQSGESGLFPESPFLAPPPPEGPSPLLRACGGFSGGFSGSQPCSRATPSRIRPHGACPACITPGRRASKRDTCLSNSLHATTSEFSSSCGFAGNASDFFLTSGNDFK